jgi:hypothetical protein
MEDFYVARRDLDGDGVPELLVLFDYSPTCGQRGCRKYIYKRASGRWEKFDGGFLVQYEHSGNPRAYYYIVLTGEVIRGHPTFIGGDEGYRWSFNPNIKAFEYTTFCVTDECRNDPDRLEQ